MASEQKALCKDLASLLIILYFDRKKRGRSAPMYWNMCKHTLKYSIWDQNNVFENIKRRLHKVKSCPALCGWIDFSQQFPGLISRWCFLPCRTFVFIVTAQEQLYFQHKVPWPFGLVKGTHHCESKMKYPGSVQTVCNDEHCHFGVTG